MRISDRYIGKQVLLGTLYAVMVLGIVLVLGRLFKEIQPLLVDLKAPPEIVLRFIINTLPVSLTYTVPWGFLTAVLIVFGRLSSGHEITSFRVAGISLPRLAAPVFLIGAGLSLISLWLNVSIVPNAKTSLREMLFDQAKRDPSSLLKPGVVIGDKYFKSDDDRTPRLLIEGKSEGWVEGFHAYFLPNSKNIAGTSREMLYVHAAKAALSANQEKGQLVLKLQDAYTETRDAKGEISMGFAGEAEPVVFNLKTSNKKIRPSTMTNEAIRWELAASEKPEEKRKLQLLSEITSRYSFSAACFAFAFIAVPLGLQTRRRDSSKGLILSLVIGTGYFLITMLADQVKDPILAKITLWSPNVLCVLLGLILFRRARFK